MNLSLSLTQGNKVNGLFTTKGEKIMKNKNLKLPIIIIAIGIIAAIAASLLLSMQVNTSQISKRFH